MDSKSDGRHFFGVFLALFFTRFGPVLWWLAVVQATGLDTWAVLSGSRCGEGNVVTLVFTWIVTMVCFWFCFLLAWACAYTLGLCSLGLVVVRAMWLLFYLVVCRSAGGWFERLGCAPWVSLW